MLWLWPRWCGWWSGSWGCATRMSVSAWLTCVGQETMGSCKMLFINSLRKYMTWGLWKTPYIDTLNIYSLYAFLDIMIVFIQVWHSVHCCIQNQPMINPSIQSNIIFIHTFPLHTPLQLGNSICQSVIVFQSKHLKGWSTVLCFVFEGPSHQG